MKTKLYNTIEIDCNCKKCHPGDYLYEILKKYKVPLDILAHQIHEDKSVIEDVIAKKIPVTNKLAEKLGKNTGISPQIWLRIQHNYDQIK